MGGGAQSPRHPTLSRHCAPSVTALTRRATSPVLCGTVEEQGQRNLLLHRVAERNGGGGRSRSGLTEGAQGRRAVAALNSRCQRPEFVTYGDVNAGIQNLSSPKPDERSVLR